MPAAIQQLRKNVQSKLQEARFFLELMDGLEANRQPILSGHEIDSQFAYLLSAFLGACYSVVAYLLEDSNHKAAAKNFRRSHPEFYDSGAEGGWRTRAVHFSPVTPQHDGYIPPPGNSVNFRSRGTGYAPPRGNSVDFAPQPGAYYFTTTTPQNSICDQCASHLSALTAFVDSQGLGS